MSTEILPVSPGFNALGADHCNQLSEEQVYKLIAVNPNTNVENTSVENTGGFHKKLNKKTKKQKNEIKKQKNEIYIKNKNYLNYLFNI